MAASGINFDSTIDEPLAEKSCPVRLFEDRAGTFDKYEGSLVLYGLKHKPRYPLMDLVCDAFWNMGFDVKADYFKAVSRLSKMKNCPIVCEFKSNHTDLGLDILEAYSDVDKIPRADLLESVNDLIISCYIPPPPQVMLNVSGKISRQSTDVEALIISVCTELGLDCEASNINYWEVVMERTGGILVEFSNMGLTKKLYNMREFVSSIPDQPLTAITFYREKLDYYYDRMLMLYGLNTKRKDCTALMLEICQDLGVDVIEDDIVRCEWFYGKATRYKALKSPLVCEFATEDKRIDVFNARNNEGDVRPDLRFQPRPRRTKKKREGEEEEEEPVAEVPVEEEARPLRPIGIVPFVSLPHYMLYVATKEFTKHNKEYQSLPMTFYGRIRLGKLQEPVAVAEGAAALDDLTKQLESLSLDEVQFIKSPLDLWKIDRSFNSSSLDKYYIFSDPYFSDKGLALEPYEWFSLPRVASDKRISRR